jgi:hypothetical protein
VAPYLNNAVYGFFDARSPALAIALLNTLRTSAPQSEPMTDALDFKVRSSPGLDWPRILFNLLSFSFITTAEAIAIIYIQLSF